MKNSYTFAGHSDYGRRFCCDAVHVGDNEAGKAIWAWRDGLWIVSARSGASVYYYATRVNADSITRPNDTKPAREALARLVQVLA